jgi:hypothetical protein
MFVLAVSPLVPAYVLLAGALLVLATASGQESRRYWLAVGIAVVSVLGLAIVASGNRMATDLQPGSQSVTQIHVLAEWLGEPVLVSRFPAFEPLVWVLMLSLLAIVLAGRETADRTPPLSLAALFVMAAAAYGLLLAGTYRTLAFSLFLFDGTAALFMLFHQQPGRAVGRLLLGVLSSAAVLGLSQGVDVPTTGPLTLGGVFTLLIWLRLGLYPLIESDKFLGPGPSLRLAWVTINLLVGLYLIPTGVANWVVWLALATTVFHGTLAWLEPDRERSLAHAAHTLAGGVLVMAAAGGDSQGVVAAASSILLGLVALALTSARLGPLSRPRSAVPPAGRIWAYVPPFLATLSLAGVPLTLGWLGRGALYQTTWAAGALGVIALVVIAEGAALSVLYRYWQLLFHDESPRKPGIWHRLGATVAAVPFLVPVLGPRLLSLLVPPQSVAVSAIPSGIGAWAGLAGPVLWALFLGYGRRWLLNALLPWRQGLMGWLRLGWLARFVARALDALSRVLLRVRAIIEGEHYLAWAILLAVCIGLLIAFYPSDISH